MSDASQSDGSLRRMSRQTNPGRPHSLFRFRASKPRAETLALEPIYRVTSPVLSRADEIFSAYEAAHRHPGNRFLHVIGLSLIFFGVLTVLSRFRWPMGGFDLTPAVILLTGLLTWYFWLHARTGAAAFFLFLILFFPADKLSVIEFFSGRIPGISLVCGVIGAGLGLLWLGHRWERTSFLPDGRWLLILAGPAYFTALFLHLIDWDGGLVDGWRGRAGNRI